MSSLPVSESFILGLIASVGGLISLIFASLRKSRCNSINCCCGFFSCNRDVMNAEELEADKSPKIKSLNNV